MSIHSLDRAEEDVNLLERRGLVYPCPCGRMRLQAEHLKPEDWARCGSCGLVHVIPIPIPKAQPRVRNLAPDGRLEPDPLSHIPPPLPHRRAVSSATTDAPASRWDLSVEEHAPTNSSRQSNAANEPSIGAAVTWFVVAVATVLYLSNRTTVLPDSQKIFLALFLAFSVFMALAPIRARSRRKRDGRSKRATPRVRLEWDQEGRDGTPPKNPDGHSKSPLD